MDPYLDDLGADSRDVRRRFVTLSLLCRLLLYLVKVPKGQKFPAPPPQAVQARLGGAVRAHRQRLGITQEELAWRADMHRTYIADIERGVRNITLRSIINLAAALQVSVSVLLAEPGEQVPAAEVGAREILVVEPDAAEAEVLVRTLTEANVKNPITVVRDGPEAFEHLAGRDAAKGRAPAPGPQLILLEANLPKGSGLDVLRRLKSEDATKDIPVAILSAQRDDRLAQECARLGAEQLLVKPVAFEKLAQIIPKLRLHWALVGRTGRG